MQFRATMKRDMRRALDQGEFKVYYQAQIDSAEGHVSGVEALLRWHHPHLGVLAPAAFLSVAEESGLIVELGNWVMDEACRQLSEWPLRLPFGCPKMSGAVNLSAFQIKQNNLDSIVKSITAKHRINSASRELESKRPVIPS